MHRCLLLSLLFGCAPEPIDDVCREAELRFQDCGVNVPFFAADECSAAPKAVAECVLEVTEGCADLSSLLQRLDRCAEDYGANLEPLDVARLDESS